jgi:hypothetical protein
VGDLAAPLDVREQEGHRAAGGRSTGRLINCACPRVRSFTHGAPRPTLGGHAGVARTARAALAILVVSEVRKAVVRRPIDEAGATEPVSTPPVSEVAGV